MVTHYKVYYEIEFPIGTTKETYAIFDSLKELVIWVQTSGNVRVKRVTLLEEKEAE